MLYFELTSQIDFSSADKFASDAVPTPYPNLNSDTASAMLVTSRVRPHKPSDDLLYQDPVKISNGEWAEQMLTTKLSEPLLQLPQMKAFHMTLPLWEYLYF